MGAYVGLVVRRDVLAETRGGGALPAERAQGQMLEVDVAVGLAHDGAGDLVGDLAGGHVAGERDDGLAVGQAEGKPVAAGEFDVGHFPAVDAGVRAAWASK